MRSRYCTFAVGLMTERIGGGNGAAMRSAKAVDIRLIGRGKSLKKRVIAVGIETTEQRSILVPQNCDAGQGY